MKEDVSLLEKAVLYDMWECVRQFDGVYDFDTNLTAEPVYSSDIPDGYSEELPDLTLQEKLDDALRRFESKARTNIRAYKGKDEGIVSHYAGWLDLLGVLRRELRR